MRFGIGEYVLITGLNFGSYHKNELPHSTRLISTNLNDDIIVKWHELKAAFVICTDKKDLWKLGLVYFVDRVLYSHEPNSKVDLSLFSLVESDEDFFNFPFGRESFERIFLGLNKDMVHNRGLYLKALEKRKTKKDGEAKYTAETKYTVYGFAIVLQY